MVLPSSEKLQDWELELPSRSAGQSEQAWWPGLVRHPWGGRYPCLRGLPARGGGSRGLSRRWFPCPGPLCSSTSVACGPRGLVCRAPFLSAGSPEALPLCSCSQWISSSCNVSLSSSLSEHFDPAPLRYLLELKNTMSSHSSTHPSEIHLRSLSYVTTQCKEITDPLIPIYSDNSEQGKIKYYYISRPRMKTQLSAMV